MLKFQNELEEASVSLNIFWRILKPVATIVVFSANNNLPLGQALASEEENLLFFETFHNIQTFIAAT